MSAAAPGLAFDPQAAGAGGRAATPDNLARAAAQFEALFVQLLLKQMRDAGPVGGKPGGGLFGSDQETLYRELLDAQLAGQLAGRSGLGIARVLLQQFGGDAARPASVTAHASAPAPIRGAGTGASAAAALAKDTPARDPAASATADSRSNRETSPIAWEQPESFVASLLPHAERLGAELGVSPRVLLAQAALETGWGRKLPGHAGGQVSNNVFGIKAGAGWQGARVATDTLEFEAGALRRHRAEFRAYPDLAASFADYAEFLRGNPRYAQALAVAGDDQAYPRALQAAGYATDPHYADKIVRITASKRLQTALEARVPAAQEVLTTAADLHMSTIAPTHHG